MNREIKFRGKRLNGQWVYGLLCHDPEKGKAYDSEWFISNRAGKPYAFAIAHSTIGQYTGLKDKNGKEIYEGDIVTFDGVHQHEVEWDNRQLGFNIVDWATQKATIVGNIHERK